MNTTRQSRTWPYDLVKGIILLILLGLMLYFRPDMSAQIQRQLGLPFGTVTVLDAPPVTGANPTTLSGHSQAGASVEVFAGEASLGTTTAGPDGSWSLPVTLPAGTYQLRAQARDAAGATVGSPAVLDWSSEQQAAADGSTAAAATTAQEAAVSEAEADTSTGTGADASTGTDTDTGAVAEPDTAAPVQSEGDTAAGAAATGAPSANAGSSASAQGSLGAAQVADGTASLSGSGTPGTTVEIVAIAAAGGAGTAGAGAVANSAGNKTDAIENTGSGDAEAGSAEAGAAERSAEAVLGSVVVAADGTWQLTAKVNPGEYVLAVRTLDADGATVDESAGVPLSVPGAATAGSAADAGQSTNPDIAANAEVTAAEPATASVSAPITTSIPSARAPQVSAPIVAGDKVTLTGMAAPGAAIELVTNDEVLGEAAADADGLWIVAVQLDPGSYALRIRTVDDTDKSVQYSRVVSLTVPAAGSAPVAAGETITAAAGVAAAVTPTATKTTTTTAAAPAAGAATVSGTVSATGTADAATPAVKGTAAVTATRAAKAGATVTTTAAVADAAAVSGTVSATGTAALATPAVKGTAVVTATAHTTAAGTTTTTVAETVAAAVTTAVTETTPATATTSAPAAAKTPAAQAASSATLTATAAGAASAVTPTATAVPPTLGQPEISGSTLTLAGTGTPGTSVEIVSGTTVLGKATVGADGSWSLASEVKPGSYKLQVVRKDAAGKVISQSPVVSLDIPSAAAPVLDTPEVAADNTITLTGTGEPGSEVDIVQDGAVIATAPVQNDGQWSYVYPAAKTGNVQVAAQVSGEPATRTRPVIFVVPVVVAPAAPAPTPTTEPTPEPTVEPTAEPEPTANASESTGGQAYVVQPGDTLTALAQEYLGSETRYKEIVAATNEMAKQDPAYKQITDPNMIVVGQQIWIPAR